MARVMSLLVPAALVLIAPSLRADDDTRKKLDDAKATYLKAMEEYRAEVAKWFDKEEEAARKLKTGATEKVKQLADDRKAFEEKHLSSPRMPVSIRMKSLKAADALVKVYLGIADGMTKNRQDAEAQKLLAELDELVAKGLESADLMKRTLIGTWGLTSDAYTADLTFKADGSVTQLNTKSGGKPSPDSSGAWGFDLPNQRVIIRGRTSRSRTSCCRSTRRRRPSRA
jgi:hypothetical protein